MKNSNAKTARRLCATSWIQVVLQARETDFIRNGNLKDVRSLLRRAAKRWGIKFDELHFEGRRMHFSVQIRRKRNFAPFIRGLTGTLALHFSGGSKNRPLQKSFWACRPWTCVIQKLKALFGPQSEHHFLLHYELAELFQGKHSEGILALGP